MANINYTEHSLDIAAQNCIFYSPHAQRDYKEYSYKRTRLWLQESGEKAKHMNVGFFWC